MHNIKENDKHQGLVQAWHGLTEIKPDLSIDDNWLRDWDINPQPLIVAPNGDLTKIQETPFKILTASDDPNITIGVPYADSYKPLSNAKFLGLLKDATEGIEGMRLVSVGSVRNRGRVFASFETQSLESYKAGGRTFKPYFNGGNGHDKSSLLWFNTSNTCTVCDNTFQMNLDQVEGEIVTGAKMRHTKNMDLALPDLGLLLRQANQSQTNFAMEFENLAEARITRAASEAILTGFVVDTDASEEDLKKISTRAKNIIGRLMQLFKRGKGNKGQTLADLFSAVTEYYTHENAGNGKNPWRQFTSSDFGAGAMTKKRFFDAITTEAGREELLKKGKKLLKGDKD